jgi:hypothetical protein
LIRERCGWRRSRARQARCRAPQITLRFVCWPSLQPLNWRRFASVQQVRPFRGCFQVQPGTRQELEVVLQIRWRLPAVNSEILRRLAVYSRTREGVSNPAIAPSAKSCRVVRRRTQFVVRAQVGGFPRGSPDHEVSPDHPAFSRAHRHGGRGRQDRGARADHPKRPRLIRRLPAIWSVSLG